MSTKHDTYNDQTQVSDTTHLNAWGTGALEIEKTQPLLPKDVENVSIAEVQTSCKTPEKQHIPSGEQLSWIQRTFGPMQPGSIRASIFTLVSTALGTGILALPYMLKMSGFALGLGLIFLGAALCWISLSMLAYASFKAQESEYYLIVNRVLGKNAAVVTSLLIAFYGFGASVGYQITIAEFFPQIVSAIMGKAYAPTDTQRLIQIMALALILFPVGLLRNLYALRHGTYLGVACIMYIIAVVIIQTPSYIAENDSFSNIVYFNFDMKFFTSFALAAFSFTCHSNMLPVRAELARANLPRLQKIVRRAVATDTILYVSIAVCGYLSLTQNTPQLIISRPKLATASSDWLIIVALAAMSFTLMISTIINQAPTRSEILVLCGKSRQADTKTHVLLTALIVFSSAIVAYAVPNVIAALGLIGGIGSVSFSITFPFLIYAKIKEREIDSGVSTAPRILVTGVRLAACLFSIIGLIGAGVSFASALNLM